MFDEACASLNRNVLCICNKHHGVTSRAALLPARCSFAIVHCPKYTVSTCPTPRPRWRTCSEYDMFLAFGDLKCTDTHDWCV